jgi:hypothetical protein
VTCHEDIELSRGTAPCILTWLKVEVIGQVQNPTILPPSKKEFEYSLNRSFGPTMPSKYHGYAAQEQFFCKKKILGI